MVETPSFLRLFGGSQTPSKSGRAAGHQPEKLQREPTERGQGEKRREDDGFRGIVGYYRDNNGIIMG